MSKSGQPATKADSGGQRLPKSSDSAGKDKKASPKKSPVKKAPAKKPGS